MPSVYLHKNSMQKTVGLLRTVQFPLPILVGSLLDNISADRKLSSHAFDAKTNKGNILIVLEEQLQKLQQDIENNKDISEVCRNINHLVCDSLSIGQISGKEFWSKKDDIIDFVSEFVPDKDKWNSTIYQWTSIEEGLVFLNKEILNTYDIYYKDAIRWFKNFTRVPSPKDVTNMVRRIVSLGSSISASFICLIYKNVYNLKNFNK